MLNTLLYYLKLWAGPLAIMAAILGLYVLLAGNLLRYEWRVYASTRRVRSWILMHLFSPVFAGLAACAAFLPASGVEGMEAMGWFFMLLVTATPLVYFLCHIILGRLLLLPELSVSESMIIATTSIAIYGGAALVFFYTMGQVHSVQRKAVRIDMRHAIAAEPLFDQRTPIRFAMPDGEKLIYVKFVQNRAASRIQVKMDYGAARFAGGIPGMHNYLCLCGDEMHLVFIEEKNGLLPTLTCYWRADGKVATFVADLVPDLSLTFDKPFTVRKIGDTLRLPIPLPRSVVVPLRENDRAITSFSEDSFCSRLGCLNATFTPNAEPLALALRLERPGLERSERHTFTFRFP